MDIVQKNWPWTSTPEQRTSTLYFVLHHTTGAQMQDTQEIWDEGIAAGDIGIAYHYVIKGDSTVVRGRPRDSVGAHAHGVNYESIGIALEGNFQPGQSNYTTPTDAQLASLKELLTELYSIYGSAVQTIGHRQVASISGDPNDATACPGDTFYAMLPEIIKGV
jgi:N-acetyl-anhydromuramyl-L-alanine amidase AmpD